MFAALLLSLPLVYAAQAPVFAPPSLGPTVPSSNYVGSSNGSLTKPTVVPGKQFDRFIQVSVSSFSSSSRSFTRRSRSGSKTPISTQRIAVYAIHRMKLIFSTHHLTGHLRFSLQARYPAGPVLRRHSPFRTKLPCDGRR